jgi:hypothetical protein
LEGYDYHERESVVRSPFETQNCDLSQTRIDHEVENVQQTQHHHGNSYEGNTPHKLEEDQNHEKNIVDLPSFPTPSYDPSHPRIEHEGESD